MGHSHDSVAGDAKTWDLNALPANPRNYNVHTVILSDSMMKNNRLSPEMVIQYGILQLYIEINFGKISTFRGSPLQ
jgi:hypothetical protein